MAVVLSGRCYPGCSGGAPGLPGMIGGGWVCSCECHRHHSGTDATTRFACGNVRTYDWDGVAPEYREMFEWMTR